MLTTLKYRIKDSVIKKHLIAQSRSVNFVWNYCNEWTKNRFDFNGQHLSKFDLNKLTSGCSSELGLLAQTIQAVCEEYVTRRGQAKKVRLNWRSQKRSLGWIPFKGEAIKLLGDGKFRYNGKIYRYWQSRIIPSKIRFGSFVQDARGKWYVCFVVKYSPVPVPESNSAIGIDLGLKTTATYSNGEKYDGARSYRAYQQQLAVAQRAKKKKRVAAICAKIAHTRKDSIHKETTRIVKQHDKIFIGDVSSTKLIKTKFAKSVLDVSWGLYRSLLEIKADRLGRVAVIVNENYSTVTCSECLNITFKGGLSTLGIREWTCGSCGSYHDRDVNAARNILRVGLHTLKEESLLEEANDKK